ncbi:molybdopterin-dependent oxidoreductase [uncultured Sphingomonas sp.]|uniref:molybdopterin-containing oxidoreductase family protein n=1 Tax=uncultured Sphingomonas sp. TaxID=158754 RepID=UPI0035CC4A8C
MLSKAAQSRALPPEPGHDGDHVSYCRICEAICGLIVTVKDGRAVKVAPDRDNPHSRGHCCVKGPAIADVTNDPERVTHPLKRVGGPGEFMRVGWDEALDDIAARLKTVLSEHGPNAAAIVFGNPGSFGMGGVMGPVLFKHATGITKTYSPTSEDIGSVVLAHTLLFDGGSYVFPDLVDADLLLIFGSNPLVSHGSLIIAPRMREDLDAIAARGRVVVLDPRRTQTAARYEHQPIRPDSDVFLLAAMINVIAQAGLANTTFLDRWTVGADALVAGLRAITPEVAAEHTGIAPGAIRRLALDYATTPRTAVMGRTGICRGSFPTLANFLLIALTIVAGKFHQPGCSGFGHGGADSGAMLAAAGMAGYAPGASRIGGMPAVLGSLPSVTLHDDIVAPGPDRIRALIVQGANPVQSMPGNARLPDAFAALDLMVAIDIYRSDTARHADYILPCTTFIEREDVPLLFLGHMVRPYAQYVDASVLPRGEAVNEFDIWRGIARRLGDDSAFAMRPMEAADATLRAGPEGDAGMGLSLDLLRRHPHGIEVPAGRWGFRLEDKLRHPDGRIHLWHDMIGAEIVRLGTAAPPRPGELKMISSRKLRSINSWMHNVDRLVRSDVPELLIHPGDAMGRGVATGDRARVSTRWGAIDVLVRVTEEMTPGCVTYPHGWGNRGGWSRAEAAGGASLNAITPASVDAVEQISGMSFLDGFPVQIERIAA